MRTFDHQTELCAREVGVKPDHVSTKCELVDHTLTGAVSAGKEFEVLQPVVLPVPVDVVDGFLGVQFPTEVLGHDVAVFHDGARATGTGQSWYRYPYIAVAFYVFFVAASFKSSLGDDHLRRYFALLTAIFLIGVYSTRVKLSSSYNCVAAVLAGQFVLLVGRFAAAFGRAAHRAVHRISTEFLLVRGQISLHHGESVSAIIAGERYRNPTCRGQRLAEPVLTPTFEAAILAASFDIARVTVERLTAVLTRFLNGHGTFLSVGTDRTVALTRWEVKYQLSGRL
jgi:hypothetical protein